MLAVIVIAGGAAWYLTRTETKLGRTGYTKEQITGLRGMPFGVKSLEKRQNELVKKLFPGGESVNATRLVVRALELRILDVDNLMPDSE